jgi:hypothetical protein
MNKELVYKLQNILLVLQVLPVLMVCRSMSFFFFRSPVAWRLAPFHIA